MEQFTEMTMAKTNSKPMRTIPFSIEPFSHAAMKGAR
jgi:hypothetical protein